MSHKAEALKGSNDYYSLIDCLEDHKKKGIKIEKIIDINFSNSYYNFYNLKKKFKNELSGIEYLKIPLTPKEIPSRKELNRIYDILNKNISKKQYIIIHCTNGVVRTGYVLVYFLCKRFEYSVEKSLKVFEQFRGHKLVNEILINDLKQKFQQ